MKKAPGKLTMGMRRWKKKTSPPLNLDPNEITGVDEDTYAEKDLENPEQIKTPRNLEPDLPFSMQTRQCRQALQRNIILTETNS